MGTILFGHTVMIRTCACLFHLFFSSLSSVNCLFLFLSSLCLCPIPLSVYSPVASCLLYVQEVLSHSVLTYLPYVQEVVNQFIEWASIINWVTTSWHTVFLKGVLLKDIPPVQEVVIPILYSKLLHKMSHYTWTYSTVLCVQEVVTPFYLVSYYIKWGNYFLDTRYVCAGDGEEGELQQLWDSLSHSPQHTKEPNQVQTDDLQILSYHLHINCR